MGKGSAMSVGSTIFVLLPLLIGSFLIVYPNHVVAAQEGEYVYEVSGSPTVARITGYSGGGGAITIPATLGGYPVVAIENEAFAYQASLITVTVPEGISSIGDRAFAYCSNLVSVTIPQSASWIFDTPFTGCSSLNAINVEGGNVNYASVDGALYNAALTVLIECPEGKEGELKVPESVSLIREQAFEGCSLTSVILDSNVTEIWNAAFQDCTSLISVNIPGGITSIGENMFRSCTSLTSITIPDSVTSIGYAAFSSCSSLISINIPDSIDSIGDYAFSDCTSLTNVTIPEGVTTIGEGAFRICTSLTAIDVNANNPHYASIDGVLFNKAVTTLIQCPGGKEGVYMIPNGVTSIGDDAFTLCTSLTSVTIPDSVTSIGSNAFSDCTSLASVTIGSNVTSIGSAAFYSCTSLTSVTIPGNVTSIGDAAFQSCSSLTSIIFQGPVAPTNVGLIWIDGTDHGIRGHANSTSNFPAPGSYFNGLKMGDTLDGVKPNDMLPLIIGAVAAIALVLVATLIILRKRKGRM